VVHFHRSVFTMVPRGKVRVVSAMLKAIHMARPVYRLAKRER
jgi:hypothetical protein